MKFTDIFIKRPVMGVALSILLVVLGVFGLSKMSTRQYPELISASVNVTVNSTGTSASSIQNFITGPLEQELAKVDDVDYMTSNSKLGTSTVSLFLVPGSNIDAAFNNVIAAVNTAKKNLPSNIDDPIVVKDSGLAVNPLYISFTSEQLTAAQLVDYLQRNVQSVFYTANGVASVEFMAPGLNLVITLDPEKISKYNLSPSIVGQVISQNNLQIAAGKLESTYKVLVNNVDGTVKSIEELKNLVVKQSNGEILKLGDIATVELKSIDGVVTSKVGGKNAVVLSFTLTPKANPISVVKELLDIYYKNVEPNIPNYIKSEVVYDGTIAVNNAIHSVIQTVFEAALIVMVVMLLFLGSLKALIVPIIAIPISIIANFIILYALGYSLNMITLLATILAIGLVVDDAIVVLENIYRHIQQGEKPFRAAIIATREIAAPVIVMTFTLAVVFLPIALTSGATGPIYKEFAITLAGSVIISGIVSLTLSPMLVNKLYNNYSPEKVSKFEHKVEGTISNINYRYYKGLKGFLKHPILATLLLLSVGFVVLTVPRQITSELTPVEDKGLFLTVASTPPNSTLKYSQLLEEEISKKLDTIPEIQTRLSVTTPTSVLNIAPLKDNRERSQQQIVQDSLKLFKDTPGLSARSINIPEITVPGSGFANFSFAVQSNDSYQNLIKYSEKMLQALKDQGVLLFGMTDVSYNQSKLNIEINRDKASELGVPIASIAKSLASYLSGGIAARVSIEDQVYNVITLLPGEEKNTTNALYHYYVTNANGTNIPLSELVTYKIESQPSSFPRLNQLNSVSISGVSLKSQSDNVKWIENNFYKYFPENYSYSLTGDLRTYVNEGSQTTVIFALAFIMIFLVLAIQFNSWRDGLVIMVTVPLALSGSFIALYICNMLRIPGATNNLYTTIGIMTLVGLITKHGILMCEVAKELQIKQGVDRKEAITRAAKLRFRPILMTTLAMVAGLLPLLFSEGSGASSRFSISLVIVSGLTVGTLFTLFILPFVYSYIGTKHKPIQEFDESIPPVAVQFEEADEDNDDEEEITKDKV